MSEHLVWPFFGEEHRVLAAGLDHWAAEHTANLPNDPDAACRQLVRELGRDGWLETCAPSDTASFDARSLCIARETLARHDALADFAFAMQGLGGGPITLAGTPDQRGRYLMAIARGEAIAAFALSEPDAGSDAAALTTHAEREGSGFVLSGTKTWISNAGIADIYVVFARTGEAPGSRGISAFLVEAGDAGFDASERIETISPHPLGTLRFTQCRLARERMIGEPGEGFRIAMRTLDVFRTSVAAAALGFARRALDAALAHAAQRRMFGNRLLDFQLTQAAIATMATDLDASALLTYRAAWLRDVRGERGTGEAAMAKMHATETAQRTIDHAVQLFGALGVTRGNVAERLYRDIRALRIYEGATEVQQLVIARETVARYERRAAEGA